jgi:hypothetical protein
MTEEQLKKALADQAAQLAEIQKTAERQGKVLALTAAERAHFDTLKGMDADAFLALNVAGRAEAVEKAAAADPVVFTAPDGTEYRKSDDQRLVKMARDSAAQSVELEKERQLRKQVELVKRAADELPNLGGDVAVKAALLGAVDTLAEDVRGQVMSTLKAHDAGLGKAFVRVGSTTGSDVSKSAADQLDEMAKAYAAENKVDMAKAYEAVVRTEKGAALYQEHRTR